MRIATGCKTEKQKMQIRRTAVKDDRIGVFIVEEEENKRHKWLNKPVAIKNFFAESNPKESVYIMLDPDMVIVKPFDQHMKVTEGNPIAQKYGIGTKWLGWNLCDSEMCKITDRKAWDWYSVGPPVVMHKNDWIKTAEAWYKFAPEVYKHDSSILSDMYSYAVGTASENIKHKTVTDMMISDANSNYYEAWNIIDVKNYEKFVPLEQNVIHFCQTYFLGSNYRDSSLAWGTFNWHKGHLPHDVMINCKFNLLVEVNTTTENFKKDKGKGRHLWTLHHLITRVNAALKNYKETYCPGWKPVHDLVLIQPESDPKNRMWYILGKFDSTGTRNELRNTNGRRIRRRLVSDDWYHWTTGGFGLPLPQGEPTAGRRLLESGAPHPPWVPTDMDEIVVEYWDTWDSPEDDLL